MSEIIEYWEYCYISQVFNPATDKITLRLFNLEEPFVHTNYTGSLISFMNELGFDGWEVINVTYDRTESGYDDTTAYLKRKKYRYA